MLGCEEFDSGVAVGGEGRGWGTGVGGEDCGAKGVGERVLQFC